MFKPSGQSFVEEATRGMATMTAAVKAARVWLGWLRLQNRAGADEDVYMSIKLAVTGGRSSIP